jgi:6-phosphogluconolactonase/glucosamine-6-phosphate isomerase/deaminase
MNIHTEEDPEVAADFIADIITKKLAIGEHVLWFATGGSSITVSALAASQIKNVDHSKLTVMMTDERYGPVGHKDSNWQQLIEKGFSLPQATLIPLLDGGTIEETTLNFGQKVEMELNKHSYKIGQFGIGADGHTCGIIPNTVAADEKLEEFSIFHKTPTFDRITITPKTILKLDEGVVFMQGQEKWHVVDDLISKELGIPEQPAQVLKKIPKLTIFTDYKNKN